MTTGATQGTPHDNDTSHARTDAPALTKTQQGVDRNMPRTPKNQAPKATTTPEQQPAPGQTAPAQPAPFNRTLLEGYALNQRDFELGIWTIVHVWPPSIAEDLAAIERGDNAAIVSIETSRVGQIGHPDGSVIDIDEEWRVIRVKFNTAAPMPYLCKTAPKP